ncbi:hypothetical protein ANCDUO_05787 [Ancylostoma duodenale]|uniref:BRCT domain-containing protein n=1 Tax=Ancylostoma duodenale TaxID=51022 RepID=A0A0C2DMR8_9BILA|nr:hypothetical protein ANCDUO_05787 [Ancylostoma duodenale]
MTTAYNFPDLNISPISIGDEEDDGDADLNTLPVHVPLEVSLKGLSISGSTPSGNPSIVPDSDPIRLEAASEDEQHLSPTRLRLTSGGRRTGQSHGLSLRLGDSFDESSEEVFIAMENKMKHSLFSVAESCDIAADLQEDSFCNILNEEQDAVCGRSAAQRFRSLDRPKENEEPRCTQTDELPYTLKKTAVAGIKSTGSKKQKDPAAARSPRKCLAPVENSSELGGLLGLKTPSQCGVYGPLVETASSLINQLQSASSSAEFVGKRHTTRIVSKNRDGVVFTGFVKEKERELHPYVRDLGLKVHSKISGRTYCVVSANGERTLNTMRAVVSGIRVVTQEWIEMCSDHNRLLPLDEFEHIRWKELIRKRGQNCALFADYGKIMVCEGCSPPSYDIQWLIEESGGEVTTDPTKCSLIVAPHQHSLEILCSEEMEVPPPVVVEKYILDCICENAVLDVDDYQEHQVVDDLL